MTGVWSLVMVRRAGSGVAVKVSWPSQVGCPSTHAVPGSGVTDPTLSTVTGASLARMVTAMVNVTVPPLGATVIGTSVGDPVPVGCPHVDPALGVHVQVAPAASSGGSGSGIGEGARSRWRCCPGWSPSPCR